ncbi:hypothetical protein HAX54_027818 [Datura stramonium]|uniref:Uncharacterized protein n=1 Tax=Datura stramonium TaxID=4076 RepID=A0ABS8V5Y3_DATST|nr:hypothetical protein [Datura stramonium]
MRGKKGCKGAAFWVSPITIRDEGEAERGEEGDWYFGATRGVLDSYFDATRGALHKHFGATRGALHRHLDSMGNARHKQGWASRKVKSQFY